MKQVTVNTYRRIWIAWSILGLGSLAVILVLSELDAGVTAEHWAWWAVLALGSFAVLELYGLFRKEKDDTWSELIWSLGSARSIVIFACAWGIVAVTTGNIWPSFPAAALAWMGWHFWKEGPYERR